VQTAAMGQIPRSTERILVLKGITSITQTALFTSSGGSSRGHLPVYYPDLIVNIRAQFFRDVVFGLGLFKRRLKTELFRRAYHC